MNLNEFFNKGEEIIWQAVPNKKNIIISFIVRALLVPAFILSLFYFDYGTRIHSTNFQYQIIIDYWNKIISISNEPFGIVYLLQNNYLFKFLLIIYLFVLGCYLGFRFVIGWTRAIIEQGISKQYLITTERVLIIKKILLSEKFIIEEIKKGKISFCLENYGYISVGGMGNIYKNEISTKEEAVTLKFLYINSVEKAKLSQIISEYKMQRPLV